jgi:hypothetical protein
VWAAKYGISAKTGIDDRRVTTLTGVSRNWNRAENWTYRNLDVRHEPELHKTVTRARLDCGR